VSVIPRVEVQQENHKRRMICFPSLKIDLAPSTKTKHSSLRKGGGFKIQSTIFSSLPPCYTFSRKMFKTSIVQLSSAERPIRTNPS